MMTNTEAKNIIQKEVLFRLNISSLESTAKEFSNSDFWYYTKLTTLNSILEGNCFHISNFENMNDVSEAELHSNEKAFTHALCFCNSNTERIPM